MRRIVWSAWLVALVAVAVACSPMPPGEPSDPGGTDDDLDQVVEALRRVSPQTEGTVWQDTTGNRLPGKIDEWFLQTPGCWGSTDCADPAGTEELLEQLADLIASATVSVDITTLFPFADGGWLDAIVDGLQRSIAAGNRPQVRWLAGTPFFYSFTGDGPDVVRARLVERVGPGAAELPISVATLTTDLQSWNHAKIVAVDGRRALVGGHNQWAASYLTATPVSDVSMRADGAAAAAAQRFVDVLWSQVCTREAEGLGGLLWIRSARSGPSTTCPRTTARLDPGTPGDVRILSVGRLGSGLPVPASVGAGGGVGAGFGGSFVPALLALLCPASEAPDLSHDAANPGQVAARELIASADERVVIAQQDLLAQCPRYDARLFRVLAEQLLRGVDMRIVTTGAFGTSYANMESLYDLSEVLFGVVTQVAGDPEVARQAICSNLQLTSLRIGPEATWPDGAGFANHSKFIHVDDQVFSVGSNNLYPSNLQELDYVVDDAAAARQVREAYLDPQWEWSRSAAIIDPEQGRCEIFG
jgi:phosphatidylserine/phosphatidylglycerophosphate/cardiolipin synthase-like enzyme